jgi:hypothetical protein
MSAWASPMLIAGGLFAGGAATFAWSRVPIWRRMPVQEFIGDFEQTLRRTDKVHLRRDRRRPARGGAPSSRSTCSAPRA